jgi:hypothetical protein
MAVYYKFNYPPGMDALSVLDEIEKEHREWQKKNGMLFCMYRLRNNNETVYYSNELDDSIYDPIFKHEDLRPQRISKDEFRQPLPQDFLKNPNVMNWGDERWLIRSRQD